MMVMMDDDDHDTVDERGEGKKKERLILDIFGYCHRMLTISWIGRLSFYFFLPKYRHLKASSYTTTTSLGGFCSMIWKISSAL